MASHIQLLTTITAEMEIPREIQIDSLTVVIDSFTKIGPLIEQTTQHDQGFLFGLSTAELRVVIAVAIPLLVLLTSNIVVLIKIRLDSNESVRKELTLMAIGNLKERLERFYNPIVALLDVNTKIFYSFGYKSYPEETEKREEASELWNRMVESIIIPNNDEIISLIKSNSHLISSEDNYSMYLDFINHAESYKHFIQFPNEAHKAFKYPVQIHENARSFQVKLKTELDQIESGINQRIEKFKK